MTEALTGTQDQHILSSKADNVADRLTEQGKPAEKGSHDTPKRKTTGKRAAHQEPEQGKEAKAQKTGHKDKAVKDTPNHQEPDTATVSPISTESTSSAQHPTVITMANPQGGVPTALPFLTEQQQQLLQSYAQASGQELANLTASSLAQAMVSPIAVPGLNLLQQLQNGNIITALPGPPHLPNQASMALQNEGDVSDNDTQGRHGTSLRNMSNDERRQRRLLRNRMAAKECRKKKKQYIQDMEDKIKLLEQENVRLHKEVSELTAKVALGGTAVHDPSESYRLMKEVEALNAKLGLGNLSANNNNTTANPNAFTAAIVAAKVGQELTPQPQPIPSSPSSTAAHTMALPAQVSNSVEKVVNDKDTAVSSAEK